MVDSRIRRASWSDLYALSVFCQYGRTGLDMSLVFAGLGDDNCNLLVSDDPFKRNRYFIVAGEV